MEVFKLITFVAVAITMTFTLILTTRDSDHSPPPSLQPPRPAASSRRPASRFLQQNARNPRAADHCHKDSGVCDRILAGRNATCCNNKCIDLEHDDKNCGACRRKCASSESCCAGECVILAYDARHCGSCSSRCMPGGHCIYGMCDYA